MSEPSNAELKAILEQMRVEGVADRRERIAFETRTTDRLAAFDRKFADTDARLAKSETAAADAEASARKAMISHESLEMAVRAEVSDVKAMLEAQNNDTERREREKKEQREAESLAAKRVSEQREYWLKRAAIWAPIVTILIATAGAVYQTYLSAKAQQANAETRQRVEQIARTPAPVWPLPDVTAHPSPAATSAPSLPAAAPARHP